MSSFDITVHRKFSYSKCLCLEWNEAKTLKRQTAIAISDFKRQTRECYSKAAFQFSILYLLVEHKLATICNSMPAE